MALIKALQEEKIAGAGLDVLEVEPIDPNNPLLKMDNVLLNLEDYAIMKLVAFCILENELKDHGF